MKPINLKFWVPFKINIQKREGLSNFKKLVFDFSLLYPKKNGLRRKSKVCPLHTQIGNWDSGYLILKFSAQVNKEWKGTVVNQRQIS